MKSSSVLFRVWCVLVVLILAVIVGAQPIYADSLSQDDLNSISNDMPFYSQYGGGSCSDGGDDGDSAASTTLNGSDNQQKAFNYFKDTEGLTDVQSAGIVGNLMVESGVNPERNQVGGGPGRGIAQWSVDGRWANLTKYADSKGEDPLALSTQLEFISLELHGTAPAGDYSGALKDLQNQTDVAGATESFMNNYERPGNPHLDVRIADAKAVLQHYGSSGGQTVSGADAPCGSGGAVNCNNSEQADQSSDLSTVRQNVVCYAQAELALWTSGQMKPGTDFYKYTNNGSHDEPWCADFISYIYKEAGYPAKTTGDHWVRIAFSFENTPQFDWHPISSNYTPVPGDVAVHSYSHVNLVVSVNSNKQSVTLIGGNQGGDVSDTGTDSKVSEYSVPSFSGDSIIGYASPKDAN